MRKNLSFLLGFLGALYCFSPSYSAKQIPRENLIYSSIDLSNENYFKSKTFLFKGFASCVDCENPVDVSTRIIKKQSFANNSFGSILCEIIFQYNFRLEESTFSVSFESKLGLLTQNMAYDSLREYFPNDSLVLKCLGNIKDSLKSEN